MAEFFSISANPIANTKIPPGPGSSPTIGAVTTIIPPITVNTKRIPARLSRGLVKFVSVTSPELGMNCYIGKMRRNNHIISIVYIDSRIDACHIRAKA